jgi:hypothetical protein
VSMEVISAASARSHAHRWQWYKRGHRTVNIYALLERMDCEEVVPSLMKCDKPCPTDVMTTN